jgi:cytochrome c biogenesis protein CcdA
MVPAFFGLSIGDANTVDGRLTGRVARGFVVGAAVSAGFTAVFTIIGALIALGLRELAQAVPIAVVIVGGLLVLAGLVLVIGHPLGLSSVSTWRPTPANPGHRLRRMIAFGAGYAVASLSCTLGVLLAVVAQATAAGQPIQVITVFAAYAAGATSILIGVAVATALAQAGLAALIRRAMPVVSRIGGGLLTLSGLYLMAYWWPAIGGGSPSASVAGLTDGISGQLTQFLDRPITSAVAAAGLALAGVVALTAARRRGQANRGSSASHTTAAAQSCDCETGPSADQILPP